MTVKSNALMEKYSLEAVRELNALNHRGKKKNDIRLLILRMNANEAENMVNNANVYNYLMGANAATNAHIASYKIVKNPMSHRVRGNYEIKTPTPTNASKTLYKNKGGKK